MGLLDRLRQGLSKTRARVAEGLRAVLPFGRKIDEGVLTDLEKALLSADMGPAMVARTIDGVRSAWKRGAVKEAQDVIPHVKSELAAMWTDDDRRIRLAPSGPTVIFVTGVNGSGKTTSVAKLAKYFKDQGKNVVLGACDTFRAAAVAQLTEWSGRIGVQIVKHQQGADPGAVAYDACEAAVARHADILLLDTAGRLHTQDHLMRELSKIHKVVERKIPGAPHEVLLVLDATIGQNAINQARVFGECVSVTGIFLAKLDGSAKGGVVMGIREQLGVPVKFVGLGETPDDVAPFDPGVFVDALFE
ncbi:MAG: signal recognition particle-docking protein FtsY [Phycisphaerales bacterium]|nr:signal recognition particle-docking protein FtsY [Phycisphaerales bacterium]